MLADCTRHPSIACSARRRPSRERRTVEPEALATTEVEDGLPLPKPPKAPKAPKPPKKKKKDLSDEEPDDEDEDNEPVELLPWAIPDGFTVSDKPDAAMLEPRNPEGKKLVGRSVLYHWADVGWCSGVIEKANGDKSKTVDGEMAL